MGQERVEGYAQGFKEGWDKSDEIIKEVIKKLEVRYEQCKEGPIANADYICGMEHTIRFLKIGLNDTNCMESEQNE